MSRFRFNDGDLHVDEERFSVWKFLRKAGFYLIASIGLALFYYLVIALVFTTEDQRRLRRQTKSIEALYADLAERNARLENVLHGLQERDRQLYRQIFDAEPPDFTSGSDAAWTADPDSALADRLVRTVSRKLMKLEYQAELTRRASERLDSALTLHLAAVPCIPSIVPVADFILTQTGATVGNRIHPFHKTLTYHTGLDLVTSPGTDVYAAADGVVTAVNRSEKGQGNTVRIEHGSGYETLYAHLGSMSVRKGQRVRRGEVIGRVGSSGLAFAPHLHYEVILNGEYVDPINYFFADLSPSAYRDMMVIAVNTGQSMD